jgi:hypothetical protein
MPTEVHTLQDTAVGFGRTCDYFQFELHFLTDLNMISAFTSRMPVSTLHTMMGIASLPTLITVSRLVWCCPGRPVEICL